MSMHLMATSWLGTDGAARWFLNIGLVLVSIGAAAAFVNEGLEAEREARPGRTLALSGAFLGAIGAALASFGIGTVGDGFVGYIPTACLGVGLVGMYVLYEVARRRIRKSKNVVAPISASSPPEKDEGDSDDQRGRRRGDLSHGDKAKR